MREERDEQIKREREWERETDRQNIEKERYRLENKKTERDRQTNIQRKIKYSDK